MAKDLIGPDVMARGAERAKKLMEGETAEGRPLPPVPKGGSVDVAIEIPRLELRSMDVMLVGDSRLVCHQWSEKAKKEMRDKQTKKASAGREAKDPQKEFEGSLYKMPDGGYGFPAIAFKSAAVTACTSVSGVTKVAARQAFHVQAELVPIYGSEPTMREDMVRVGMGTADIRYRGEFTSWFTILPITYNARALSPEQIINLFNVAGFAVGIGEHRPECDGSWGLFHCATSEEQEKLLKTLKK